MIQLCIFLPPFSLKKRHYEYIDLVLQRYISQIVQVYVWFTKKGASGKRHIADGILYLIASSQKCCTVVNKKPDYSVLKSNQVGTTIRRNAIKCKLEVAQRDHRPVPECPFAWQQLGLRLPHEPDNPSNMLQEK